MWVLRSKLRSPSWLGQYSADHPISIPLIFILLIVFKMFSLAMVSVFIHGIVKLFLVCFFFFFFLELSLMTNVMSYIICYFVHSVF